MPSIKYVAYAECRATSRILIRPLRISLAISARSLPATPLAKRRRSSLSCFAKAALPLISSRSLRSCSSSISCSGIAVRHAGQRLGGQLGDGALVRQIHAGSEQTQDDRPSHIDERRRLVNQAEHLNDNKSGSSVAGYGAGPRFGSNGPGSSSNAGDYCLVG